MKELLNNYTNIGTEEVWKTVPNGWLITLGIIAFAFFILVLWTAFGLKHKPIISIIEATVYTACLIGFCALLIHIKYEEDLRQEKAIEIAEFVIKNNIDLQITDKYFIYEGKTYKHNIDNIDNCIVMDKNGKLIIVED